MASSTTLPVADDFADLVVACSALTPAAAHGGDPAWRRWSGSAGRVAASSSSGQTTSTGSPPMAIRYASFAGEMFVEFASYEEAVELASIFYPEAVAEVRRLGRSAGSV